MKYLHGVEIVDVFGRPLRGGRGLKCPIRGSRIPVRRSPPARGAWVEINIFVLCWILKRQVAPCAGGVG